MNQTERAEILQMVERGQVSAEEAINMLSAESLPAAEEPQPPVVEEFHPPVQAPHPPQAKAHSPRAGRYLHIQITNLETDTPHVKVNLPLSWMRFGWKIGSRFVPELEDLDIDELMLPLDQASPIPLVEVEDRERIEIYIA